MSVKTGSRSFPVKASHDPFRQYPLRGELDLRSRFYPRLNLSAGIETIISSKISPSAIAL